MGVRPEQQMIASRKISKGKLLEVIKELLDGNTAITKIKSRGWRP